jgi:hypothetical protein
MVADGSSGQENRPGTTPLPPAVEDAIRAAQTEPKPDPPARADATVPTPDDPKPSARGSADKPPAKEPRRVSLDSIRSKVASVVWLVAVLAALVLALGALCVSLDLNQDNTIVEAILDLAGTLDFGVFKTFSGEDAETKEALVNWGIAAVIWLVVGKVLDKLIRP